MTSVGSIVNLIQAGELETAREIISRCPEFFWDIVDTAQMMLFFDSDSSGQFMTQLTIVLSTTISEFKNFAPPNFDGDLFFATSIIGAALKYVFINNNLDPQDIYLVYLKTWFANARATWLSENSMLNTMKGILRVRYPGLTEEEVSDYINYVLTIIN